MANTSDTAVLTDLIRKADEVLPVSDVYNLPDGRKFVAHRADVAIKDISNPAEVKIIFPQVVAQLVKLTDAGSMSSYMNRFKNEDSLMFADIAASRIVGMLDYHSAGDAGGKVEAKLCRHQAHLQLQFSKEWQVWTTSDQRLVDHVTFAGFLEENALDVHSPSGADLLEICRDLQVKQDMHFSSSVRMGDKVSIQYSKEENATTKSAMELPTEFVIAIPVYFNEPSVLIRCMMRRKIETGELKLGFKMIRAENIRQTEFQRIVSEIEANTDRDAVYGVAG